MCETRLWLELLTGGPERKRENARVSVADASMPQKQRPRILRLRAFHLVFEVCIFLAHFPPYNLFCLYFISKFSLLDEKSRGLGPRRSPAGALTSRIVPSMPQLPTPQNGPLRDAPQLVYTVAVQNTGRWAPEHTAKGHRVTEPRESPIISALVVLATLS